jgi:hypothetical protein
MRSEAATDPRRKPARPLVQWSAAPRKPWFPLALTIAAAVLAASLILAGAR